MRVYIGYKYRNFKDKQALRNILERISETITSMGHNTFILGRDEFEWNHHKRPSKSVAPIIKNMRKNDVLFAIIECESKSNGLLIESIFARILGKKVVLAVKKGVSATPFKFFSHNIIEFEDYENLLSLVRNDLQKYL